MRITHTTLIAMIQYVNSGVWKVELDPFITEQMVLDCFEHLFQIELKKETTFKQGSNPYNGEGIPLIELFLDDTKYFYFLYKDEKSFLSCLICGFKNDLNGKKLCFNVKHKGHTGHYFKFLSNGNNEWVEMNSIFNFTYEFKSFPNQNIRRLISLFYERQFPFVKTWGIDDALIDYDPAEKNEMKEYFGGYENVK